MMAANTVRSSSESGIQCDICKQGDIDDNDIPTATHYCIECNENQCSKCSEFHGKLNASKDHKLVNISDKLVRKFDSQEFLVDAYYENKMPQTEQQEHLEDPVHDDLPSDIQEQVKKESDCGFENKNFERKLEDSRKEIKHLAHELEESRKETVQIKEQNRILKENFDAALDREKNLKKELVAIKRRSKSGIFENVQEALDNTSKSSKPQQSHTSSSDLNISIYERKLRLLSSCCNCSRTLQDNRMTPCFHIACLKCLEDIQSKTTKQPGDALPCPSCGKTFAIPSKGLTGLPKNLFLKSPLEIEKSFNLKNETKNCEIHCENVLDHYCKNCETVVCISCFYENHKAHDCKDFRGGLEEITRKLSRQKQEVLSKRKDIKRLKKEYLAKSFETSKKIKKKIDILKSLIEQDARILLDELSTIEQKHQRNMDKEIGDIENNAKLLDSFITFCTQMKVKGSTNALYRCGYNLIATAEELSKENEEYLHSPSKLVEVEFIAKHQDETIQVGANVIGKLSETSKFIESKVFVIGINDGVSITKDITEINLNRSENVSKGQQIPVKMIPESAAAVHCDSIFVTGIGNNRDEIWRFNATSSKWKKCASMVQGRRCHSVAFVDHILYICGGWVDSKKETLDDVEAYDAHKDQCAALGKLAFGVHGSGNCVPFKSSLYIFGGFDVNDKIVNKVQVYDTKLNTSSRLSKPMPTSQYLLGAALWENTVILLGHNGCFTYNFEKGVWKDRDRFKTDVVHFGLAMNNGLVFVIGGGNSIKGADGNSKWICRDDVRCVPVVNILNDEPIEWKHHAKLPKPSMLHAYGRIDLV